MEYKIIKETHPTLKNYGKYKAVAMHYKTVTPEEIADEIERNCSAKKSDVDLVMAEFSSPTRWCDTSKTATACVSRDWDWLSWRSTARRSPVRRHSAPHSTSMV